MHRNLLLPHPNNCSSVGIERSTVAIPGAYDRPTLLSILFRETDRVQRMKTALCLILFGIDICEGGDSHIEVWGCDEV